MSTCPTVKVVSPEAPGGFVIINENDRKPHHKIWTGKDENPAVQSDQKSAMSQTIFADTAEDNKPSIHQTGSRQRAKS